MYEVVAEHHRPERAFLPDTLRCHRLNNIAYLFCKGVVAWIGLAVDQERPINIAALRKLITSERARYDNARILGIQVRQPMPKLQSLCLSQVTRFSQMSPLDAESLLQLFHPRRH